MDGARKRLALISVNASPLATLGDPVLGAQNICVGQVARHLTDFGWQVDVFARRDDPALPHLVHHTPGVRVINVPAGPPSTVREEELLPHLVEFTDYLIRFMQRRTETYDVIHANCFTSGLVALNIKRALGVPFVVTFHALGRVRAGGASERLAIEDQVADEADRVIAGCPAVRQDLIEHYHADNRRICLVPCGFDPREFHPIDRREARAKLGLPAEGTLLLQLGRLVTQQGVDTVIEALARLRRTHGREATLIVVGGTPSVPDPAQGPEIERLAQVAQREGAGEHVIFTGTRPRAWLKYYYNAADLFLAVPRHEPSGLTPLEAMACGTPVVGANAGGIPYSVRHCVTGMLVPPRNPDVLAAKTAWLLERPQLLASMRTQSLRRAARMFTWDKVAGSLDAIHARVVAEHCHEAAVGGRALRGRFASAF